MIKKTWIIPHEAFEIFGWMFLDGFDVLKLYLYRLAAKAAKVSFSHFWKEKKICLLWRNTRRKKNLEFKTSKGD